jgi:ABC-type transport system involved in cytochrome c biogenesis permease subunit
MTRQDPGEVQNLDTISGGAYATAIMAAMALFFAFYIPAIRQAFDTNLWSPADAPWLRIHIFAYCFSYFLYFTGFVLSILYVYVNGRPRLPWVEIGTVAATLLAVAGLFMGMVFMRLTSGVWWVWDNKLTFALLATLVLVVITPLAAMNRSFGRPQQRDLALFIHLLIAVVLFTASLLIGLVFTSIIHPAWLLGGAIQ